MPPANALLTLMVGVVFVRKNHQITAAITPPMTTDSSRTTGIVAIGAGILAVSPYFKNRCSILSKKNDSTSAPTPDVIPKTMVESTSTLAFCLNHGV